MVQPVSDDQLATEGMQLHSQGRVLLIACGALAREILALMKANGWQHMDLQCLPAVYHNTPDKITPAVKACIEKYRERLFGDFCSLCRLRHRGAATNPLRCDGRVDDFRAALLQFL